MYKARSNNCRDITIMQTKVTPRQKMKRQVNFIFLANCISQTMDKEMWISVFMHWRIQVMGPGGHRSPPPLFPLFFRPNWGLKGRENFFWDLPPSPPPRPPVFEGLDPLLLCPFSLVHSKNQAANQMTYHDVIRLPIVWIVGALATVHQLFRENYRKSVRPNCSRKLGIWI